MALKYNSASKMVQTNSDWLRNLEFLSLLISVIGWPIFFLSGAVLTWIIIVPETAFPAVAEFGCLLLLIFGFSWNTRYNGGGIMFVQPLKNYLEHKETEDNRRIGRFSFISIFFLVFLYFGLLSAIFP